jgi:competence protein ComGC
MKTRLNRGFTLIELLVVIGKMLLQFVRKLLMKSKEGLQFGSTNTIRQVKRPGCLELH